MALYLFANAAVATSAAPTPVATGAAIKTLLQLTPKSLGTTTLPGGVVTGVGRVKIKEWGISFNGSAAGTPVKVELLETNGYATVTAAVARDVMKFDNYYAPDPDLWFGTNETGYNASNEGTPGYSRLFDLQYVAPTNQYVKQYPLGLEPVLFGGFNLRIRVTAAATVDAYCYVLFEM